MDVMVDMWCDVMCVDVMWFVLMWCDGWWIDCCNMISAIIAVWIWWLLLICISSIYLPLHTGCMYLLARNYRWSGWMSSSWSSSSSYELQCMSSYSHHTSYHHRALYHTLSSCHHHTIIIPHYTSSSCPHHHSTAGINGSMTLPSSF